MRKYITILSCIMLTILSIYTTVNAASVPPETIPGNDSNDYTPPEGCILYEIPDSDLEGTHTVKFNAAGVVDPDGVIHLLLL